MDMVRSTRMAFSCLRVLEVCPQRIMHADPSWPVKLGEQPLIPAAFNCFWSEHSERTVLNGWAAMLGCSKDERDKLGHWQASQSDDYLRAARAT
eukprot:2883446-Karenia_brevis.AAC.1